MKKLAVAVIHGMSSEEQFYSVELKHRITEEYVAGAQGRLEDDLLFHEIYWGDLVKDANKELLEKTNYKSDLSYANLRSMWIDYLGTTLAYHRDNSELYKIIHRRIGESLKKFASHRRVDADNTPLVVLAHSFGGVLMSDYLKSMAAMRDSGDATYNKKSAFERLDTLVGLVTFGCPLAIFSVQRETTEKPAQFIGQALPEDLQKRARWYNFYDKDDVIAYPLKGISEAYDQAVYADIEVNVGSAATSWNPACHQGYWEDKDFYKPVAEFLGEIRAPHQFWH